MKRSDDPNKAIAGVGDLLIDLAAARVAATAAVRAAGREIGRMPSTVTAIRGLPQRILDVSDSPSGRDIAAAYSGRHRGIPLTTAVSVLDLPETPERYLTGRRRQAVRTNCTRARAGGLRYAAPDSAEHAVELIMQITAERRYRTQEREWLLRRHRRAGGEIRCVLDGASAPISLLHYTTDGELTRLDVGVSADGEFTSAARYLLSAELFVELAGRGVRVVISDSDLFNAGGVRYFKKLLGFEPANVRFRRASDGGAAPGRGGESESGRVSLAARG